MQKLKLKNRKEQTIVGVLEQPTAGSKGTCVIQHGWGGNKERPTVQAIKRAFLELGFQTFAFDTTNASGESDGDYEQSTLGLHWEDLEDVVKWVQKQDWFIGPLALSGHSMGGYAVARYAEDYPNQVSYLVPVAPVVSGKLSFAEHNKHDPESFKTWKEKGFRKRIKSNGKPATERWFQMEERLKHNLLPNAGKLTMPTLLLVGSKDTSCFDQTQALYDHLPEENKTLQIIEDAPHSFSTKKDLASCSNHIKTWLQNLL